MDHASEWQINSKCEANARKANDRLIAEVQELSSKSNT
jgi:hypothetical protein